ncbi:(2Fe-2S) ferredoxin domain-containing protein [Undibacterium sp. FT147W]|uniref:(2Fe-2S) ferredoxin domain-containing protein n=1 Tax=Undibacterium rivi TaxID=2828729 RepID=A0ABS5GYA6_9BURK|nr:(2Fe-2S) ferredoxin domain-containing protein [Undibacterium rivi]MBR7791427.1 (2Fe-2S) ferredoxin domain-containing protein [Undibacterium rivi]
MSEPLYFQKHVFFCMNQRDDGRPCCTDHGAQAAQEHAKRRIKQMDMNGQGKIRINKAGCLDRCDEGPVMVIYPQGTWYTFVDQTDIDEIIDVDLVGGGIVKRLQLPNT